MALYIRLYSTSKVNFIYLFDCATQLVGSWFPNQGPNRCLLQWKHRVLTTGPPGNFLKSKINSCRKEKKKANEKTESSCHTADNCDQTFCQELRKIE